MERIPAAESGLPTETVFLCFQTRALDHSRFPAQAAGRLKSASLRRVERAVRACLGL